MPVSMKDIARESGVSVATVSRVLNGSATVREELRARVLSSVEKLGYQPNMVARSLRMRKTMVIGVIIPNILNPFFTDIVRGVEDAALKAGYVVTVLSSDQSLAKERRYLQLLRNRMVDGVLIAVAHQRESDLTPLVERGLPVVLVDRSLDGAPFDRVTVDTWRGAYLGAELLIQRGYRRIAFLGGPNSVSTAADKLAGYRAALEDYGVQIDERLVLEGDYTEASGHDLGRRLLDMPDRPDAVLVANNLMTLGFYTIVREYGLRVPHEIAFVGFDDRPWAALAIPPITMIDQPTYELGRSATEMLLARMSGEVEGEPRQVVLPCKLVIRGSA